MEPQHQANAATIANNKLACTIMQTFTKDKPMSIVFLIDGSGSIEPADFDGPIKRGALGMIKHLKKARVAVVQFSTTVQVAAELTGDKHAVEEGVNWMKQMRNSTATRSAIEHATNMLADVGAGNDKMIIIITDGKPDKGQEPGPAVEEAQRKGISIFALGIGAGVEEEALREMSTNGQYFSIKDYQNFILAIEEAQQMAQQPQIEVDFHPLGRELVSGDPIPVRVGVRNLKAEDTIPGRSKLEIQADKYFTFGQYIIPDAIKPHEVGYVDIVLRPKSNAKEFEFPGQVGFTWTSGGNIQKGFATLATGYLRGDFVRSDDIPVNCLLFGQRGCGKSSLINALVTALTTKQSPSNSMVVANSDTHVTTAYGKVSVASLVTRADADGLPRGAPLPPASEVSLMMYDTWGFSDTDYKNVRIHHMIDGQIKPGTSMTEVDRKLQPPSLVDAIHVVVFVIPLSAGSESSLLEGFNEHILDAIKAGMNPIVVATFIDEVENAEENEKLRQRFLANIKVNGGSVFFHKNYTSQHIRDIDIDLSSRNVLRAIYQRANDYINIQNPIRYRNVKWVKHTILKPDDEQFIDQPVQQQSPQQPQQQQQQYRHQQQPIHSPQQPSTPVTPQTHAPSYARSSPEPYVAKPLTYSETPQPRYEQHSNNDNHYYEPSEPSVEVPAEQSVDLSSSVSLSSSTASSPSSVGVSIDLGGKKRNVRVTSDMTFVELLERYLPASHRDQGYFLVDEKTRAKVTPTQRVIEHGSKAFAFADSSMEITLMAEGLASRKVKVQGDKTVGEVLAQYTPKTMRGQDVELVDEENFALDPRLKISDAPGKAFKIQVSGW